MGDDVARLETPPEEPPFPLTDVDKWILSQTDEEFERHDWAGLTEIIGEISRQRALRSTCLPLTLTS